MHLPRRCSFQLGEVIHEMGKKKQRRFVCNQLPVGSDISSHVLTVGSRGRGKKLNLCGILWKRPCPRSWNLLSQACVMWLHPALPSSAPSLLLSGDFYVRTADPFPLAFRAIQTVFMLSIRLLVDSDHVDHQSARSMTQDLRMLDFDFVPFPQMPTRWMRLTEWKSPLVVIR